MLGYLIHPQALLAGTKKDPKGCHRYVAGTNTPDFSFMMWETTISAKWSVFFGLHQKPFHLVDGEVCSVVEY